MDPGRFKPGSNINISGSDPKKPDPEPILKEQCLNLTFFKNTDPDPTKAPEAGCAILLFTAFHSFLKHGGGQSCKKNASLFSFQSDKLNFARVMQTYLHTTD